MKLEGTSTKGHKVILTFLAVPLKCVTRAHALPTDCLAACAVLPPTLKKTEGAFQETAIIISLDITKLRMQESENAKQKEGAQNWGQ